MSTYANERKSRKPQNIKQHNEKLVISYIQSTNYTSAAAISKKLNLSVTTVSKILLTLQEKQIIHIIGKGSSTNEGGKRPDLFALNSEFCYALGCRIYSTHCKILLTNFNCVKIDQKEFTLSNPDHFDSVIRDFSDAVREILLTNKIPASKVCGISVGFDGTVNAESGFIIYPIHNITWGNNIPAKDILQKYLPEFTISINNEGRYASYSLFKEHPEYKNQTIFVLSSGVGSLIRQGIIDIGSNGMLGEIGHIAISTDHKGIVCSCGNYDCFEAHTSDANLLAYAKECSIQHPQDPFSNHLNRTNFMENLFYAAETGSPIAMDVLNRLADYYTTIIRNIIFISDPDLIIVINPDQKGEGYFAKKLQENLRSLPLISHDRLLHIALHKTWDPETAQLGAALFSINNYLLTLGSL